MLTLTPCWFLRRHTPSDSISRKQSGVYFSSCRFCERPIISSDRNNWDLAEGFNLNTVYASSSSNYLYIVDLLNDLVISRFSIDHLSCEAEIAAYAEQITHDYGIDKSDGTLALRDSRNGSRRKRRTAPAPTAAAAPIEPRPDNDRLTGLPGRKSFEDSFATVCRVGATSKRRVSLAIVDIDRLDAINRRIGLDAGDEIVKRVADELRAMAGTRCHISRNRGLEFLVLFEDTGLNLAVARIKSVQAVLAGALQETLGGDILAISAGLAEIDLAGDARAALREADLALHKVKAAGGNGVGASADG